MSDDENNRINIESLNQNQILSENIVNYFTYKNTPVDNKINVSYVRNPIKNNKYLNDKIADCLICYNKLKNNVVCINNRYCKCFYNVLLCNSCFLMWFNKNNKCFICRKSFNSNPQNQYELYKFSERLLLIKLIENMFKNTESEDKFKLNMNIFIPFTANNLEEPLPELNEIIVPTFPTFPLREGLSRTLVRPIISQPYIIEDINNIPLEDVDSINTEICTWINIKKNIDTIIIIFLFLGGVLSFFIVNFVK